MQQPLRIKNTDDPGSHLVVGNSEPIKFWIMRISTGSRLLVINRTTDDKRVYQSERRADYSGFPVIQAQSEAVERGLYLLSSEGK